MHELPPGCLDGIRVIDLTTILMGPLGTRILGDLGADVIRIETLEGDSLRNSVPARNPGMSGILLNVHRNKRSVALDLKSDMGREAALTIIDSADVVVTNMRRSALTRLGLGPETLSARKPELIVCVANGYGSGGPYAERAAYDDAVQAGSGLSWLVGQVQDRPGYLPTIIADKVCGMVIAQAVLAALVHRYRTGQGQNIEVPMLETMVAFNLLDHQRGHVFEPPIGPFGYDRLLSPYRRPVRTADGWACILPYANQQWQAFFRVADRPDLATDARFTDHNARIANIDELYRLLDEIAALHTIAEWQILCDANSIPMSPVLDLPDAAADPHLAAVGLFEPENHPSEGHYRNVAEPVRYEHAPAGLRRHAPRLGQHTIEVLTEVGFDPGVVRAMLDAGQARET
ncbi:MAG: CoA transferase [Actinomycetota bacterium]|nr:CoA transferase [Actinomycetota bacterium]